ncbi:type II toxin-antitoxin system Phd/YefM family antitoxin [Caldilinea sp.]|uniref:type II toxin-antitoxin system Phd/YefM family antitoxin n=1 Tax=Caldilinea sp. TaxID=2293560 RepID=UPI002C393158|nr:type II toxin-antitoxin system Phd/YefM family antitoxin [Anaerolineales bacterium]HQY91962.1 type II toxin-antitoxin system Phd/YefM family antitoxin [Caldilinea sp.]HRA66752.1 type II toxin-antitoxin system Phd/YefM family antitoxin [Caldilinea sp.]
MSYPAMKTVPVTDLRTRQPEIFDGLKDAPILLTRQGHGAGVLVHPDAWNQIVEDLRCYRRLARIERARRDLDAGNAYTFEQVEVLLEADGLLP